MKIFKIACMILLLVASSAFAGDCTDIRYISGLTEQQTQVMIADCEKTKLEKMTGNTEGVIEQADRWAEVSVKFVKAFSLVAKEANVAVNEFITTPAGMMAAALIVWNVMGEDIMQFVAAACLVILSLFIMIIARVYLRSLLLVREENITVKGIFGGERVKTVKKYISSSALSDDHGYGQSSDKTYYHLVYIASHVICVMLIVVAICMIGS